MTSEVIVAVIAGVVALSSVLLTHRLANSRDIRASLERDIETLRKLNPGEAATKALERLVSDNIYRLADTESRRGLYGLARRLTVAAVATLLPLVSVMVWLALGPPDPVRELLDIGFVLLAVVSGALAGSAALAASNLSGRARKMNGIRKRAAHLRLTRTAVETTIEELRVIDETKGTLDEHKGAIVDAFGQKRWDALESMLREAQPRRDATKGAPSGADSASAGEGGTPAPADGA
ncbi:hypothetical protein [Mycobacteroides abscessus]|uniref:hypothetical protein n=1 Tax=Mycobacteroides abscessus TaxID=36809 RepID=UPI00092C9A1A|nr:hypothetical protein [Mycobacteroides abscessus]SHX65095.1 Uncharacterised protein [Mycobacteroides abscessus subsp. abscessus]SHZ17853.1 Uncharacterised protein [Mycobacteroides abscessus subsp. abscessus]SIB51250.1 Uncharacterised protein [Mycobacteroides abscessus subsp. abscessus]SIF18198.1 Uncharacterised protein [Mycobacteroides abscessus subsp. abscessus]SKI48128.1 Uncharacterised protein [Mycobacteroides abscessus subsp. abscessus]